MSDESKKSSYLKYLPAVYQEDAESKEFLERFLSIFESLLDESDKKISSLPEYFDPMAAPPDFVPWLANWLSLDLYELLGDRNRKYILHAVEFYKQKGTVLGLASLVTLLTGRKCCVKEYMNNVFRSYGMEHDNAFDDNEVDEYGCRKFYHKISKIVDTKNSNLMSNIGKDSYYDEVHYVTDTHNEGRYSTHVIGIFITVSSEEKEFIIDPNQLRKIINSFLPVFVRAEIIIVEELEDTYYINDIIDGYTDEINETVVEQFSNVKGVYKDEVNWKWLYTYSSGYNGYTNDLNFRTPHSKISVELML